eukprot:GHVS01067116.1.p1 GENE.GHVS01067116.1~~GHVS01067116.1.p1  ORF type:complete len:764 (+),score=77.92 GHVS01067116.1:125-2416(+)
MLGRQLSHVHRRRGVTMTSLIRPVRYLSHVCSHHHNHLRHHAQSISSSRSSMCFSRTLPPSQQQHSNVYGPSRHLLTSWHHFSSFRDYAQHKMHEASIMLPETFWREQSSQVHWFQPYSSVLSLPGPSRHRWFDGGLVNISYDCLDIHILAGRGDNAALIYECPLTSTKEVISYSQLHSQVSRLADGLWHLGVRLGDRVVLYMPTIPQTVMAMLACARIGAIHSVVFGGFAAPQLAMRIEHAQAKVVIAASCGIEPHGPVDYKINLVMAMAQLRLKHVEVPQCVVLQRPQLPGVLLDGEKSWGEMMEAGRQRDAVPVESNHPLFVAYTSGTTGQPKGVVRAHAGQMVSGKFAFEFIYDCRPGDTFFVAADIGWVLGHSCTVYGTLINGCTSVVFEGKPSPDPGVFWRICEEHRVKSLFTSATAIRAVRQLDQEARLMNGRDLSNLRTVYVAGERTDTITFNWLQSHLTRQAQESGTRAPLVVDNWWQSETGWPITSIMRCFKGSRGIPPRAGSCGHVIPGWDLRVLDDAGNEVEDGQAGNVVVKLPLPPGAFTTLWKAEELFITAYFARFPGFYDTGDHGVIGEDGYVQILSRTDDVINVSGYRLSTAAMEECLMRRAGVMEAVVVAVQDTVKGHLPLGLVVLADDIEVAGKSDEVLGKDERDDIIKRELVQRVRSDIGPLASFKMCVVVRKLPKTISGKVLRGTIAAIADGREYAVPATIEDKSALFHLEECLIEQLGMPKHRPALYQPEGKGGLQSQGSAP